MRSLEAMDRSIAVVVRGDRVAVEARLGHPARHREGRGCRGDHASGTVGRISAVTNESTIGSVSNVKWCIAQM